MASTNDESVTGEFLAQWENAAAVQNIACRGHGGECVVSAAVLKLVAECRRLRLLSAVPPKPPEARPRSPLWPAFRLKIIKAQPFCSACGSTDHLEVHHVQPFAYFPELELFASNCMVLCEDAGNCHFMIGHLKDWTRYHPNPRSAAATYLKWSRSRLPKQIPV